MAIVQYLEKKKNTDGNTALGQTGKALVPAAVEQGTGSSGAGGGQPASLYRAAQAGGGNGGGLSGLSQSTQAALQQYGQGYKPSAAVTEAKSYLQSVMSGGPGAFQSKYADQIASLYDQIMNRPKFQYDVNKDPLFQQYKNQYMRNGQRAMQDAIGNAAALTGGYGSSWGNTAGFQAYQYYLQQLNDRIPELEQYAFGKYQYEGNELRSNMDMSVNLDNIDYGRYRDTVQDWKDERAFASGLYSQEQAADMSQWQSTQDYYKALAGMENSDYWNRENLAYQYAQAGQDQALKWAQLAQDQNQYDAGMAYKYYGANLDEAYRRAQLAQNQSQHNSDLAYKYYGANLDEAYRRESLRQNQNQWAAEQALNQAKFDFQVRQYEDQLAQALGGGGSASGGVRTTAQSGGQYASDTVNPQIKKTNAQGTANAGPLAAAAPAVSQAQWAQMQRQMEQALKASQGKTQDRTALLVQAAQKRTEKKKK